MPKRLPPDEERFVRNYVREGGEEEHIRAAEKRARLKMGTGARVLKLKRVQDAVKERMEPIRLEQQRQQLVGEAVVQATAQLQEERDRLQQAMEQIVALPAMRVMGNEQVIEQELMKLVRLCPEKFGRIKLAAIQTSFVVAGLMEQGTTRRVSPPDSAKISDGKGVYASLFDRLRAEPKAEPAVVEAVEGSDGVFDLTPQKVEIAMVPAVLWMPPPGESIDPVRIPKGAARVITVEVG